MGGGGQESVNQKFTFHFYSYTSRVKVIQTQKRVCGTASRGGGGHSTSQLDRGVPLGGGGGSKPDPVIMRSAHEKYTLSQYLTKNIQMHTLLQYCTPRIYPV